MEDTIPIKIVKAMMEVLCSFDFEKALAVLKTFGDDRKYEEMTELELKDFVAENLLEVYQKAIEEKSTYYFCSTGFFRFEYNDEDFRVALELVEWNTAY